MILRENETNASFAERIAKSSILGWLNIDLEPASQTFVSVIIKGDNVFLTSLYEGCLEKVAPSYLVNNFCGGLLVNNIDCDAYQEGNFIQNRSYRIYDILESPLESFGNMNYLTLLRFANLCKAALTESAKTNKTYFIYMYYAEDTLCIFEDNGVELPDADECILDELDVDIVAAYETCVNILNE